MSSSRDEPAECGVRSNGDTGEWLCEELPLWCENGTVNGGEFGSG